MNRLARCVVAVLGLAPAACNTADVRHPARTADPARNEAAPPPATPDAFEEPYAGQRHARAGHVYTTDRVPARLGSHLLAFPAHYYANQTGPDVQGNVTLRLLWPAMEPYAPGDGAAGVSDPMREVVVAFDVLPDRAISEVRVRQVTRQPHEDPADPRNDLSTRIATVFPDGVTGYSVDPERQRRFADGQHPHAAAEILNPRSTLNDDWFVVRDDAGAIATLIKCDPKSVTEVDMDGLQPRLRPGGRMSRCVHQFLVPNLQLRIRMDYRRTCLPEWRSMEARVRSLIAAAAASR